MAGRLAFVLIAFACLSGCVSDSTRGQRLARYRPDITPKERMPWEHAGARRNSGITRPDVDQPRAVKGRGERPPGHAVGVLEYGDRITISLLGIPDESAPINEVIDTEGMITLRHISRVKIVGLSTSDAEKLIETIYIEKGIYLSIDVVVISLVEGSYIMVGEVRKTGKYPIIGEITLLGAISQAGGPTPFANKKKVQIIRGDRSLYFNTEKIEKNEKEDPVIQSNDKIVVPRGWI